MMIFERQAQAFGTFDETALTITAIIATDSPVIRKDRAGTYAEILDMAGVDLAQISDLPLLDSHRDGTVGAVIGRAYNFRRDGNRIIADLRFSAADDVAPIRQRVADGTLTAFSIGYAVARWAEAIEGGNRTKRAVNWTLREVSIVGQPADPQAKRIRQMPKDIAETEEQRTALVEMLSRTVTLPADFATRAAELSLAEIMELAEEEGEAIKPKKRSAAIIRTTAPQNDDPAVLVRRQSDALAYRAAGGTLADDARPFVNLSLLDMARDSLAREGVSTRAMSADEVFQRAAHGTSDFPLVVSNAANKMALDSYKAAESPLKQLARQRSLSNFKPSTSIRLGEMGALEPLTEQGEFTATGRAEAGESLSIGTFGRRFDITRKLLIDDDLGLLGDTVAALGQAAAQTEAQILFNLIVAPPLMADGVSPFNGSRDNVTAGAPLAVEGLSEARLAMRQRTGTDRATLIDAKPKYLLVGPELETLAEQLLADLNPSAPGDVNPFAGKLTLLVEPRLTGTDWYLFADPARLSTLQYAYLSGAEGVQIQGQEAWNTLGLSYRAFLDFGGGWVDWRGAQKMTA